MRQNLFSWKQGVFAAFVLILCHKYDALKTGINFRSLSIIKADLTSEPKKDNVNRSLLTAISVFFAVTMSTGSPMDIGKSSSAAYAATSLSFLDSKEPSPVLSKGWEMARQKRTNAIKDLAEKGIVKLDTDDSGTQYLSLPWIPDQKVPYKRLSFSQRLKNEVCAGAFGEICKDLILHPIDTMKTRRQAQKKQQQHSPSDADADVDEKMRRLTAENAGEETASPFILLKNLYTGFPAVMTSSIPQGGVFFLVKRGLIETISKASPMLPEFVTSIVSIGFGVMAYWVFRTPTEVIKTKVQTGKSTNVVEGLAAALEEEKGKVRGLWKHYSVMLSLDVPFQVMNFILYGIISDAVLNAGFEASTLTRLFCGVTCGMVCAGITTPLDMCKTRIISRDRNRGAAVPVFPGNSFATATATGVDRAENIMSVDIPSEALLGALGERDSPSPAASAETERPREFACPGSGSGSGSSTTSLLQDKRQMATTSAAEHRPAHETDSEKTLFAAAAVSPIAGVSESSGEALEPPTQPSPNVLSEIASVYRDEGIGALFLGLRQRLLYTGLANGIRLAAYGTSRMDLMMRSLDDL